MYNSQSLHAQDFIDHAEIIESIDYATKNKNNLSLIAQILAKAKEGKGLNHRESAILLLSEDKDIEKQIFSLASALKQEFYGNRIVLFAPLYLSNYCINSCTYCPYHTSNKTITRKKLSQEEIAKEVIALQDMGHKRLAIESGEHPLHNSLDYILESIETIYSIKHKNGSIRRVNVNIAATSIEEYEKLAKAQIGTYILFQETYHKDTYEALHPAGPKHDYAYHTEAMDRAMQAGIDDVGLGVLFGLNMYKYDFIGLLMHAEHLEAVYNVGPHTISVPRICPADNVDINSFDNGISDEIFAKIVAILRITVPYTGLILSTRESQEVREKLIHLGISQISGASKTSVGGYHSDKKENSKENSKQFEISDTRTLNEIVDWLIEAKHIPSFCTACYKLNRTGDRFMALAKHGQIKNVCQPNALMTLEEYAQDYASHSTKEKIESFIQSEFSSITHPKIKSQCIENIAKIKNGERDFRF